MEQRSKNFCCHFRQCFAYSDQPRHIVRCPGKVYTTCVYVLHALSTSVSLHATIHRPPTSWHAAKRTKMDSVCTSSSASTTARDSFWAQSCQSFLTASTSSLSVCSSLRRSASLPSSSCSFLLFLLCTKSRCRARRTRSPSSHWPMSLVGRLQNEFV